MMDAPACTVENLSDGDPIPMRTVGCQRALCVLWSDRHEHDLGSRGERGCSTQLPQQLVAGGSSAHLLCYFFFDETGGAEPLQEIYWSEKSSTGITDQKERKEKKEL